MKKTLVYILLLLCVYAYADNYPTDTVNGQVVYRYPVQKSEGLWRISQNFGVSQEEIVKLNPELATTGLKLGQTILIPKKETIDSTQYIVHELQPKETLYGLSKQYGVRISQIQELNPEAAKRMAIGSRLLIKKKENITAQPIAVVETPKVEEKIEEKIERTEQSTPNLADTLVPIFLLFPPDSLPKIDSTLSEQPITPFEPQPTIRIAFLLPFMTSAIHRDANTDRFIEFYEGALLAIYKAQLTGQQFEIYAYDTEKSDIKLKQILSQPEFSTFNAIVGPAYPSQVSIASDFAFEHHIPVLIPFTQKVSDINRNPYLLQFNPTERQETNALVDYLSERGDSIMCVIESTAVGETTANMMMLRQTLKNRNIPTKTFTQQQLKADSLFTSLSADRENILFFNSERYSAIAPFTEHLLAANNNYQITVFSQYSWQKEQLVLPQLYTSVFKKVNRIEEPMIDYSQLFKKYFSHTIDNNHPRYDLLGYDLTTWLISMLLTNSEQEFSERITNTRTIGLQSDIYFRQVTPQGGFENQLIHIQH